MEELIGNLSSLLWGKVLWVLILAVGGYLSFRLAWMPLRKIPFAFRVLARGHKQDEVGSVTPFSALMVSLSATVGTGNIVGVAAAIAIGGPGALFWMWMSALLGMATKYAESVCAITYRETNANGEFVGGPMYYIKNGLSRSWRPMAALFAIFGALAGFGIGNAVQANAVANALEVGFGFNRMWSAPLMAILVGLVLLGGLKGIAAAARSLVPFMAVVYVAAGLGVILLNIDSLPETLALVFTGAFTGTAAQGGFAGAVVALAVEKGISRGVFSNEAGLGSAPIAHAAAKTNSPVEQGCVAMLGTFIDTLVICSVTGLAILMTGVWVHDIPSSSLSQAAFASALPYGDKVVALCLSLFAFTTILGWSYYGERCAEYLFGTRVKFVYRLLWVAVVPLGVLASLDLVWSFADLLNGLMALPNLIALVLLAGLVKRQTVEYFRS